MNLETIDLKAANEQLKNKTPKEVVKWALDMGLKPVITTNFRPYEGAILHLVTSLNNDIEKISS